MLSKSAGIRIRAEPQYQHIITSPWNYCWCMGMENVISVTVAIPYLCQQTKTDVQVGQPLSSFHTYNTSR